MLPLIGALYASIRPYAETSKKGFFSLPDTLTFQNYRDAFSQGEMAHHFWNTILIVVPALIIKGLPENIVAGNYSSDGHRITTAGADGRISFWDAATREEVANWRTEESKRK